MTELGKDPRTWWQWLTCWGWCPCRPYQDGDGCDGQCLRCGRVVGFVTWEQLRRYADKVVKR